MPDAVVIGGGIIGCSVARELRLRGHSVVLLERSTIGAEASSAAAGMVAPQHGDEEPGPVMDLWRASRDLYPEFVSALEGESGRSIGFRPGGTLVVAFDETRLHRLMHHAAWQSAAGLAVEVLSTQEIRTRWPFVTPQIKGGFFLARDGWVDNPALMRAFASALPRIGVEVRTGVSATALNRSGDRVTGLHSTDGSIDAPIVVNAAGAWMHDVGGAELPRLVNPLRGQMLALEAPGLVQSCAVNGGDFILVPRSPGKVLVGATMERVGFEPRPTVGGVSSLLAKAVKGIPALAEASFAEVWTGFRPESVDGLPIIGPTPIEGYYLAGGHTAKGILLAPITAAAISSLIHRDPPPVNVAPFTPMRFVAG